MRPIPADRRSRYVTVDGASAYLPPPLPPDLHYDGELVALLSDAERALGALNGIGRLQPNPTLLVVPYMHREAVVSSRIEGTQASLADVLMLEAGQAAPDQPNDAREVLNYVDAMRTGMHRITEVPLHLNLVRDMHRTLMDGVRGHNRAPGEFRKIVVWIGSPGRPIQDATYVPPPPTEMLERLYAWEKYLNTGDVVPPLIKCALVHYQFEALHPFLDGNGRIGRLINILYLLERKVLEFPLLYLSGYFDRYREHYYQHLQNVTERDDWLGWIKYFVAAVQAQALSAVQDCDKLLKLLDDYRRRGHAIGNSKYIPAVIDQLVANPFVTARMIEAAHKTTYKTANSVVTQLVEAGILTEITGRHRNRLFVARELLDVVQAEEIEQRPIRY